MLFGEWNWDTAKSVWQEEAKEEGVAIGQEMVLDLVKQGLSAKEIERILSKKAR